MREALRQRLTHVRSLLRHIAILDTAAPQIGWVASLPHAPLTDSAESSTRTKTAD